METFNATNARQNLYKLINQTNQTHMPIQILGKSGNAVLLSEEDWRAIEETMFLQSIPGMTKSLIEARNTPIEECEKLDWDSLK